MIEKYLSIGLGLLAAIALKILISSVMELGRILKEGSADD